MSFDDNMGKLETRSRAEARHCFDVSIKRADGGVMIRTFSTTTKWEAIEHAFTSNKHVQQDRTKYSAKKRTVK